MACNGCGTCYANMKIELSQRYFLDEILAPLRGSTSLWGRMTEALRPRLQFFPPLRGCSNSFHIAHIRFRGKTMKYTATLLLAVTLLLSGCVMGPNYQRP